MADPKKALLKRLNSFTSMSSQQNLNEEAKPGDAHGKKSTLRSKRGGRYQGGDHPVPFNKNKDRRRSIVDMAPDIPANNSKLTSKSKSKRNFKVSLGPSKTLRRAMKSGVELTATQKKILALENKVLNNLKTKTLPVSKGRASKRLTKKISKVKAKTSLEGSAMIKSEEQKAFIQKILEKTVFFEGINEKNLASIVNAMYIEEVEENEVIINEGDMGSRFYILYEGELARETTSWDNEFDNNGTLSKGDTFGDRALLYDSPNEFTILATEPSLVFILDRKVYRDLLAKIQANDRSQILTSLRRVPVLQGLTDDTLEELVDFIEEMTFKKGDQVIKKGETGTELYVLKSGVVKCTNIGETDGVMNDLFLYENDYFGEAALIKNQPRAADIFCESDVATLYKIDRDIFEKVFGPLKELLEKNWQMRILKTIPIFSEIDDEGILEGLLEISEEEVISEKGKKIVTKGKKLSHFYIILEGKVCIYAHKRMLPTGKKQSNASTDDESVFGIDGVEQISKEEFDAVAELEQVKTRAVRKKDRRVKEIGQIVDTLKGVTIEDDKGEPLAEFTDENGISYELVSVVESGNYIGESCLLGELPLADVLTKTAVKLLKFDVAKVNHILSNPTGSKQTGSGAVQIVESDSENNDSAKRKRRHKKKNKSSGSKKYSNLVKAKIEEKFEERRRNTMIAEKVDINFHDLKRFQTLGTGTFGRVRLVQDKESMHFYALKIISKKKVVEYSQKKNVYNEKQAMLESDHPFILKLYATYKDETNIYMLLELVQGGELFSLMRKLKKRTDAKFYAACVLLGLEYLHNKRLIYRDIKPENILLDKQGYVKIVDFGFAKRVKSRTYTMCGTPEYMAPEIFLRKGYNKAVDFWALGICFFEMCFGYTPFADERNNDHIQVCKNIVRNRLKYPEMNPKVLNRLSKENRAKRERKYLARRRLVKALLRKDPRTRAGMKKHGVDQIKREEVFNSIDWEKLEAKKYPTPWRPRIKDEKDCSHFMKYPENERVDSYVDDGTGWDVDF